MRLWLIVALLGVVCQANQYDKFKGKEIVRITPRQESDATHVDMMLDWGHFKLLKKHKDGSYDILMHEPMRARFQAYDFNVEVLTADVHKVIKKQKYRDPASLRNTRHNVTWTHYNTLDEINEYLYSVAEEHADIATVEEFGTTWEGRSMKMITLTNGGNRADKPILFIDAGIHAREWIAPAVATYIIDQLVKDTTGLLDSAVWIIVPSINPDGYQHSWDKDRLWRKTRSKRAGSSCYGVDGNRNFDFHWMEIGASDDECSDVYAGPEPNSEPEFKALVDYMTANKAQVKMYITLHSYSQLFMYPYGHSSELPENWEELDATAKLATEAIEAVHGTKYEYGACGAILYYDAGTSRDYVKGVAGVRWVYTIELPDTGNFGFLLPPEQILPTAEETWEGIKVVSTAAVQ